MFKKLLSLILAALLLMGLASCAEKPDDTETTAATEDSTAPTTDHVVPFDPSVPSTTSPTEATEPSEPVETTTMRLVANASLMYEPDEHAASAMVLQAGNEVEVAGFQKDWAQVIIGDKTYYVPYGSVRGLDEYLIVIDAGHQAKGNSEQEPIGPNAAETKDKVTSGTQGTVTGLAEYQLNLTVALKLQAVLEQRGYKVAMIRTNHEINMSNSERAQVANNMYADAFIRIHANSSTDSSVHGIETICQTKDNLYNSAIYEECKALSEAVLEETAAATGAKARRVWETDSMSGINWCTVPVTIVEMGFMSNPEEDALMATEEYQDKLALGIANGIDKYFAD